MSDTTTFGKGLQEDREWKPTQVKHSICNIINTTIFIRLKAK